MRKKTLTQVCVFRHVPYFQMVRWIGSAQLSLYQCWLASSTTRYLYLPAIAYSISEPGSLLLTTKNKALVQSRRGRDLVCGCPKHWNRNCFWGKKQKWSLFNEKRCGKELMPSLYAFQLSRSIPTTTFHWSGERTSAGNLGVKKKQLLTIKHHWLFTKKLWRCAVLGLLQFEPRLKPSRSLSTLCLFVNKIFIYGMFIGMKQTQILIAALVITINSKKHKLNMITCVRCVLAVWVWQ